MLQLGVRCITPVFAALALCVLPACHTASLNVLVQPPGTDDAEEWTYDLDRVERDGTEVDALPLHDATSLAAWMRTHAGVHLDVTSDGEFGAAVLLQADDVLVAVVSGVRRDDGDERTESWALVGARRPWGDRTYVVCRRFGALDVRTTSMVSYSNASSRRWTIGSWDLLDRWSFVGLIRTSDDLLSEPESDATPSD